MHGDWPGAMDCSLDDLWLGSDIPQHDGFIGFEEEPRMQQIGRHTAWDACAHLNAVQARAAARRMQEILHRQVSETDSWREIKWAGQRWLLQLFQQPNWRAEMQKHYGTSWQEEWDRLENNDDKLNFISFRSMSEKSLMVNYSAYIDRIIAESRKPVMTRAPIPDPTGPLLVLVPDFNRIIGFIAYNDTQNALLLTALALQAFHVEHGAYPPALAALVPKYLPKIPDDPFARAGNLLYALRGEHYLLYSIGPDGKDDGGIPMANEDMMAGVRFFPLSSQTPQGDIVAGTSVR